MAKVKFYDAAPDYEYAGNFIRGMQDDSDVSKSATAFSYVSEAGYTVTFSGTGFKYDGDIPSGGNVTGITVTSGAGTVMDMTGVVAKLQALYFLAVGYDREGDSPQNPDDDGFFRQVLRGDDSITGSSHGDDILGGGHAGNDTVNGLGGNDYIKGDAGNDKLDGGDGDYDTLSYRQSQYDATAYRGIVLDAEAGTVTDSWGGHDTFKNFEDYQDSIFDDDITGSDADETFELSRGDDTLVGGGGFDRVNYHNAIRDGGLHGIKADLSAGTIVDAWGGLDEVHGIRGVAGTSKNDTMLGSSGDDSFQGFKGKDSFDGRGGGHDEVVFWDNKDLGATKGISVDLSLSSGQIKSDGFGNVETAKNIEGIDGSDLNDTITGSAAENFLSGGNGADKISGGGDGDHLDGGNGKDTLTGGEGGDQFNFHEKGSSNYDKITDFESGEDHVWVDSAWGGLSADHLSKSQFLAADDATEAATSSQRVIYNTTDGKLYYDDDGAGGHDAVLFAQLTDVATLTYKDILVFI